VSVPPESIQTGECYLTSMGTVRRVAGLLPGRVRYEQRPAHRPTWANHRTDILDLRSFAFSVERPVPCDWTAESDET
jgi:hypothetical protein